MSEVRCQHCRGWFRRPEHVAADRAVQACELPLCQQIQAEYERDLAAQVDRLEAAIRRGRRHVEEETIVAPRFL